MVCRGACPADEKSIAQTAGAVGKTAKVQKSLKGFLKKISTQARVREEVREKKSAGTERGRNRQREALGAKRERNRQGDCFCRVRVIK